MAENLKKGDQVTWRSHGQTVHGTIEKKITSRTSESARTVDASPDDPQFKVRSDKSGRDAVHRPEALNREH
jgi:DUF2945 family protein